MTQITTLLEFLEFKSSYKNAKYVKVCFKVDVVNWSETSEED